MACRGVLFALTDEQSDRLLAAAEVGDDAVEELIEEIDNAWDEAYQVEVQKFWDAIHRCLSDGTTCFDGGTFPLNRVILGGRQLYRGDDYIVASVTKNEVPYVASALPAVSESWFREQYFALSTTDFPQIYVNEEWFGYTWECFKEIRAFYRRSAKENRAVVFTADQ